MYKGLSSGDFSDEQKCYMDLHHGYAFHVRVQLYLLGDKLRLDLREQGKLSREFAKWASLKICVFSFLPFYSRKNVYYMTVR